MKRHILICLGILATFFSNAQYNDMGPANNMRTPGNPLYWKNKQPFTGYWQQDVHYTIKANIDETTDIIDGDEQLTYYNNSPDTLYFVYFHMYQNAFQPGAYLDDLQKNNGVKPAYGKYEGGQQGIVVQNISVNGRELKTYLDNTILKVWLDKPLYPNSEVTFNLKFRTFYDTGSTRRRFKKYKSAGYNHYNGCQWYPKMCVYDRKAGWNTDQHLNREFYGDYGTFDVELTFASNYVLEATGVLQNESEVLPDTLKKKLDIHNFKDKKWEEKPSVITPYKRGQVKTWKYHAENVHDFAFTADPTYRIHDTIIYPGRVNGAGVRCVAICQEQHASGWQTASDYLSKIITVFSRDFGVFEYPKIVVADAADGMEYPMITLDGGKDPEYKGLLVHEVGHNWFYGMIGNNETYRACMDEGFTQFLTAWGMEALDGDTIVYEKIKNKYVRKFYEPLNVRDNKAYLSYLSDAINFDDEGLNTHSDHFHGALGQGGGYRHVYSKTATMLYNLQYVLGDSLFIKAMQHYVTQWKFCHPYPEDFRNSISQFTHQDLNWFFDEWMEGNRNNDYGITGVKKGEREDEYKITFKRYGRMQMPLDFQVIAKDGRRYNYYIPNTWFEKSTTATTLPKWYGWDKLQPTYTAVVTIPKGVKNVVIDPSERMADINMLNNRLKGNTELRFDSRIYPQMSWKKYRVWMRPDVWYNAYDGFKIGMNVYGNYMGSRHNFNFTWWINTHLLQGGAFYKFSGEQKKKAGWFSYRFDYSTPLDNEKMLRKVTFYYSSRWLDGYEMYKLGFSKQFGNGFSADINIKAFTRNREEWRNYLLYPGEWSTIWDGDNKFNTSLNLGLTYSYAKSKANGNVAARLRSSSLFSSANYHYAEITNINHTSFWKFDLHSRIYGRYGTGGELPDESALYLSGGNPEEMMESKYYRAAAFVPDNWVGAYGNNINHLHFGGGLNLRGYAGYLAPEIDKNNALAFTYKGNSGFAVNAELDFNRIVPVKNVWLRSRFTLNTYLFADMGMINYTNSSENNQLSNLRMDAGAGVALTFKRFGPLQNIKPLTIRFDVPFFVNRPPAVSNKYVDFRWMLGISRAF
jgi:hypothetical protein